MPAWIEALEEEVAQYQQEQKQKAEEDRKEAGQAAIDQIKEWLPGLLPAGVEIVEWIHTTPDSYGQCAAGAKVHLGDDVIVEVWDQNADSYCLRTSPGANPKAVALMLMKAYKNELGNREKKAAQEAQKREVEAERERQRQEREAREASLATAYDILHPLAHEVWGTECDEEAPCHGDVHVWEALEVQKPYHGDVDQAIEQAKANHSEIMARKRIRAELLKESAKLCYLKEGITLYRLYYSQGCQCQDSDNVVTAYSLDSEPDEDGWWEIIDGDDTRNEKLLTLFRIEEVELEPCKADDLPYELRVRDTLERDSAHLRYYRPSRALQG